MFENRLVCRFRKPNKNSSPFKFSSHALCIYGTRVNSPIFNKTIIKNELSIEVDEGYEENASDWEREEADCKKERQIKGEWAQIEWHIWVENMISPMNTVINGLDKIFIDSIEIDTILSLVSPHQLDYCVAM